MEDTNIAKKSGKYFLPKTANAIFKINGNVAFTATANTSANVDITTTQDQIKAGQTNSVIGVITSEKAVSVKFSTPEWQPEFLAANIGTTIRYGKQNFVIDNVPYTAGEGGTLTLQEEPANGVVQVELNGNWITVPVTGKTASLAEYGVKTGECLKVMGVFPQTGKEISLLVDTAPSIGELTLSSPIFKGTEGQCGYSQYVFPSFALSGNWSQAYSTNASYEISGTAIAVAGEKCGESDTYGYYREYIKDDNLDNFVKIVAAPSVVELKSNETQQLAVYGIRGELSEKAEITGSVKYAVAESGASVATVDSKGLITAVGEGSTTVTVTYGEGKYTATVNVTVTTA